MTRRQVLALLGTTAGAVVGAGLYGRHAFLAPAPSRTLDTVRDLSIRLYDSLEGAVRAQACVPYDHPLRQYHNRGVSTGGIDIRSTSFSRAQRSILTDILYAGLSGQGRDRVPDQFYIHWPGVHLMRLVICGDPHTDLYQVILSGPHLNFRAGGRNREGVAFGGPQIYGDQRGNLRPGLPGNIYRYQFETGRRLFRSLSAEEQRAALLPREPIQTQIELQGSGGVFAGVAVETLSSGSRALVTELIDDILSTYHPEDVDYARQCLERNGGIEGLTLSYYEIGEDGGRSQLQIFRLEGPAAVLYFRGYPHVHAFVNIGMDGDRPLSVGEVVGENPAVLEGERVQRLFETAMRSQTGADLAFYGPESVVGRLRTGTIRTGDIYNLESWQDRVSLVEIQGAQIRGPFLEQIRRGGVTLSPGRVYAVATAGTVDEEPAYQSLGRTASQEPGGLLRDVVIAHLQAHGFGSAA